MLGWKLGPSLCPGPLNREGAYLVCRNEVLRGSGSHGVHPGMTLKQDKGRGCDAYDCSCSGSRTVGRESRTCCTDPSHQISKGRVPSSMGTKVQAEVGRTPLQKTSIPGYLLTVPNPDLVLTTPQYTYSLAIPLAIDLQGGAWECAGTEKPLLWHPLMTLAMCTLTPTCWALPLDPEAPHTFSWCCLQHFVISLVPQALCQLC